MGKNEQFHQYGYDHYLKAPKKPSAKRSAVAKGGIGSRLQNPAVASVALLAAAVLFTGVVIATYPSKENADASIPIVKADLSPMKRAPADRGGMDIRNAESTVLSRSKSISVPDGVENLLARSMPEPMVMKAEALEIATNKPEALQEDEYLEEPRTIVVTAPIPEPEPIVEAVSVPQLKEPSSPVIEVVSSESLDSKAAADVLQKLGSSEAQASTKFVQQVASAAVVKKPKHKPMHAAGQSPETLEFVRNVLNNKEPDVRSANRVAAIKPAAGAASPKAVVSLSPGDFYVQLASIKDRARAGREWTKMKSKYSALGGADYRVQQASLNSGTFYRIQAGPMSKISADKVCASLKSAKKPGGCLVVKK